MSKYIFKYLTGIFFICFFSVIAYSQPKTDFSKILIEKELNPSISVPSYELANTLNLPVEIYIPGKAMIQAVSIENGKVVYAVSTDLLNPLKSGYCDFYDNIINKFDLSKARLSYVSGECRDFTNETLNIKNKALYSKLYLIPCMTISRRNVFAFDYITGDLVDTAFIPYSNPILQTPRKALQISASKIIVVDQLSDAVQEFDSSGAYIKIYAPSTGVNTSIMHNARDMVFRSNGNLLVTNAGSSGNSQNTVQQFDTAGIFTNTFASDSLNSPYNLLYNNGKLFVSNSSGINDVVKFNSGNGSYMGNFLTSALNFPQQMINLDGGKIAICEFSGALSGIRIYDTTGVLIDTNKAVTGIRGVWVLPNGNFLVTNSVGVYEVDAVSHSVVRTIVSGYNFTCISVYDPNFITGIHNEGGIIPSSPVLHDCYPNPFNPITKISFSIPKSGMVRLSIFDVTGREIAVPLNEVRPAGNYSFDFDASKLSSGVYFYRLQTGNFNQAKSMILIK